MRLLHISMKCFFPKCDEEAFVHRKNRFGEWFRLCKEHYRMVEMVSEP